MDKQIESAHIIVKAQPLISLPKTKEYSSEETKELIIITIRND